MVIVSNQVEFFEGFDQTCGADLPFLEDHGWLIRCEKRWPNRWRAPARRAGSFFDPGRNSPSCRMRATCAYLGTALPSDDPAVVGRDEFGNSLGRLDGLAQRFGVSGRGHARQG
jgi:hypothetical protein